MKLRRPVLATIVCASLIPPLASSAGAQSETPTPVNVESVLALLECVDIIVQRNPEYVQLREHLAGLDEQFHASRLKELVAKNAEDPAITQSIDRFLNTEARRVYFRRFRNVTPDQFRQALLALPYARLSMPGDLARPYFDLVGTSASLRLDITRLVDEVDLRECYDLAVRWLPEGASSKVPDVYLVYDNNAGSYVAEGKVFYNAYIGESAEELAESGTATIAHEIHHVLAGPYFQFGRRAHPSWEGQAMDEVIRDMVSEGSAQHCNPPSGVKREVWEHPKTIETLLDQLERTFLALSAHELSEEGFRKWRSDATHELPLAILRERAAERWGVDMADSVMRENASIRPDVAHALGWWMLSRVSGEGRDPGAVGDLVRHPYDLFERYNAAVAASAPELSVDASVVAACR